MCESIFENRIDRLKHAESKIKQLISVQEDITGALTALIGTSDLYWTKNVVTYAKIYWKSNTHQTRFDMVALGNARDKHDKDMNNFIRDNKILFNRLKLNEEILTRLKKRHIVLQNEIRLSYVRN